MDLGTAKPTSAEQAAVPHHVLDVVNPGEYFSAADFQRLANNAIRDIQARGKMPFLVGGTGLYVDSVIFAYDFSAQTNAVYTREQVEAFSNEELFTKLREQSPGVATELLEQYRSNRRHLVGAVMAGGVQRNRRTEPLPGTLIVGLNPGRDILTERITARAETMFESGVLDEAARLAESFGWDSEAMTGNIYRIARRLLCGEITAAQAKSLFITSDLQLAKRQMTWFKRNKSITWFDAPEQATEFLTTKCMQTP